MGKQVSLVFSSQQWQSVFPELGAEGQFESSEVPRAPSALPSEMGIFLLFFFLILIWSFSVCVRTHSPDANNEENILSDKGENTEIKMNEVGKL